MSEIWPWKFVGAFIDPGQVSYFRDTVRATHCTTSRDHRVLFSLARLIFAFCSGTDVRAS